MSCLFTFPNVTESVTLVRQEAGHINGYEKSIEGSEARKEVTVIAVSLSGEGQLVLPKALREKKPRRSWTKGSIEALDDDHAGAVLDSRGEQVWAMRVTNGPIVL